MFFFFFAQPPASIKNDLLIIGVDNYLFNQRLKVIWFIIPFKDCYSLLVLAPTVPVNILAKCEGTPRWTWESWQRSSKSCTLATGRRAGEVVRYGGSLQDTPDGFFLPNMAVKSPTYKWRFGNSWKIICEWWIFWLAMFDDTGGQVICFFGSSSAGRQSAVNMIHHEMANHHEDYVHVFPPLAQNVPGPSFGWRGSGGSWYPQNSGYLNVSIVSHDYLQKHQFIQRMTFCVSSSCCCCCCCCCFCCCCCCCCCCCWCCCCCCCCCWCCCCWSF